MKSIAKNALAAAALAALPLVAACSDGAEADAETLSETRDESTQSLGGALGAMNDVSTLRNALTETELAGILDGPASYTVLAPNDAAFEKLGEASADLSEEEQKPILLAIVRDHLLPGHLTPETIRSAIEAQGGSVSMTTLGEGSVTFAMDGENLTVSLGDGAQARVIGEPVASNNGVVIPLDTVLVPSENG